MKDYLMLTLAAFLLAGDIAMNKIYERYAGTTMKAGFRFNVLLGFLSALIFWVMGGFSFHVTPFSILMAGVIASLGMSYNLLGFRILKSAIFFFCKTRSATSHIWLSVQRRAVCASSSILHPLPRHSVL